MRLFLDCEFTKLSAAAKLISLALVAEDGREFYVELLDAWKVEDCSEFVIRIVLPQLWAGAHALGARSEMLAHDRFHIQRFYSVSGRCPELLESLHYRANENLHLSIPYAGVCANLTAA